MVVVRLTRLSREVMEVPMLGYSKKMKLLSILF